MKLSDSVGIIKGVGKEIESKLAMLGVKTVGQLIDYLPRRYNDFSVVQSANKIRPGAVSLKVTVKQAKGRYVRRGMHITEAVASDDTGSVRLVWFNQPYRAAALKADKQYFVSGEYALRRQHFSISNPSVELVSDFPVNTARIVPIYRETKGFKSAQIRRLIRELTPLIDDLKETLPSWLVKEHKLIAKSAAIASMHFPPSSKGLEQAKKRLGFEEVFELTLASLLNKTDALTQNAVKIPFKLDLAKKFVSQLPFKLTDTQKRAVWQIYKDLESPSPMNRMLEGDVGSGKTVVAVMAAVMAIKQGFQVVFMAPTELLARQHAVTIHELLKPLKMESEIGLLVGGLKPAQKKLIQSKIAQGDVKLIIGTHAVFQEKVDMTNLGLVIIDEQHRFGVEQRKQLLKKAKHMPHVLSMTATPIPRSLALTLYGELDISILDAKPAGRKSITTKIVSPNSRKQLYKTIDKQLDNGHQMFVVCPLIKPSEAFAARSAEEVYEDLRKTTFKHRKIGLLHGKMKPDDKDAMMQRFVDHKLDILVSTTVIEVGVNVKNASVMLIENAERFGLAQAHQLRGRVGRSHHQGYCYLVMGDSSAPSRRLRALESSTDGFKLAELDLEIRGPGAIYGTMQHGALDLRVAKLTDVKLIATARQSAQKFIDKGENLIQYTELNNRVNELRTVTNLS